MLLGRRPLSVRRPSAERPLELDSRIPAAQLGWQGEFITCTMGDTTHSGCGILLVYLYKQAGRGGRPSAIHSSRFANLQETAFQACRTFEGTALYPLRSVKSIEVWANWQVGVH